MCRACTGTSPAPLFACTFSLPRPVQFCPYRPRTGLPPCLPCRPFPAGIAPVSDPYRFARTGHVPCTRRSPFLDRYRTHILTLSNPCPTGRPTVPIHFSQCFPVSDTCQYNFRIVQWRSIAACLMLILIGCSVHAKSAIVNSNPLPGCFSWSSRYVVFRPFLWFTEVWSVQFNLYFLVFKALVASDAWRSFHYVTDNTNIDKTFFLLLLSRTVFFVA